MAAQPRFLIVNADDFGRNSGINEGIMAAHQNGIVTSASLMVRWPHALAAAEYARSQPDLSIGLHFDLGEWMFRGGAWHPEYVVVERSDAAAVEREIRSQLATFRELMGREPTHMDSHQHVHRKEPVRPIVRGVGVELGIPVREMDCRVRYCGAFYGQTKAGERWAEGITVEALIEVLRGLKPGFTELACHPAAEADLISTYRTERLEELETLCDPRIQAAVRELRIELCSFHRLASAGA